MTTEDKEPQIDYKKLLVKYMGLVRWSESVNFVGWLYDPYLHNRFNISETEWRELSRIATTPDNAETYK